MELEQLIRLGRKRKRNADYNALHNIIPELIQLRDLIGMEKVKTAITAQIVYYLQDLGTTDMLHTVIQGPSGVGKTVLAKIISKLYLKLGFLTNDKFIIAKRSDLIGGYLGQTAIKTQKKIDDANGGVLFIDEAYALGNTGDGDSYSKECIDTLVSNLAERRDFICIIAGYESDLESCFFSRNQGLERRFPWRYTIPTYTAIELYLIFKKQARDDKWALLIDHSFFADKLDKFPHMGGDTETLLAKCKIAHGLRMFGKPRFLKKLINNLDLKNAFELYQEHSLKKQEPDNPPPGMYL